MTAIVYDYADINARLMNGFREPEPKRSTEIVLPVSQPPVKLKTFVMDCGTGIGVGINDAGSLYQQAINDLIVQDAINLRRSGL